MGSPERLRADSPERLDALATAKDDGEPPRRHHDAVQRCDSGCRFERAT